VIPFWGGRQANDKKPNLRYSSGCVFFFWNMLAGETKITLEKATNQSRRIKGLLA